MSRVFLADAFIKYYATDNQSDLDAAKKYQIDFTNIVKKMMSKASGN